MQSACAAGEKEAGARPIAAIAIPKVALIFIIRLNGRAAARTRAACTGVIGGRYSDLRRKGADCDESPLHIRSSGSALFAFVLVARLEHLDLLVEARGLLLQRLDGGVVPLGMDRFDLLDLIGRSIGASRFDPGIHLLLQAAQVCRDL